MMTFEKLHSLLALATAAGIDPSAIDDATAELDNAGRMITELWRQRDARKAKTAALAARVQREYFRFIRNGIKDGIVVKLADLYGLRRSRVYQLLRVSTVTLDNLVV
jgi:hypothetical protein